jgi:hypothetical protein
VSKIFIPDLDFLPIPDPGIKNALDPDLKGISKGGCHEIVYLSGDEFL